MSNNKNWLWRRHPSWNRSLAPAHALESFAGPLAPQALARQGQMHLQAQDGRNCTVMDSGTMHRIGIAFSSGLSCELALEPEPEQPEPDLAPTAAPADSVAPVHPPFRVPAPARHASRGLSAAVAPLAHATAEALAAAISRWCPSSGPIPRPKHAFYQCKQSENIGNSKAHVGKLAAWFVLDPVVPDSNTKNVKQQKKSSCS